MYEVWCVAKVNVTKSPTLTFCPYEYFFTIDRRCKQLDAKMLDQNIPLNRQLNFSIDDRLNTAIPETHVQIVAATITANSSGILFCADSWSLNDSMTFIVSDVPSAEENGGFTIELEPAGNFRNGLHNLIECSSILLTCKTSIVKDNGTLKWFFKPKGELNFIPTEYLLYDGIKQTTNYSNVYNLRIENILRNQSGMYQCSHQSNSTDKRFVNINVQYKPEEGKNGSDKKLNVVYGENLTIKCDAVGNPVPSVSWTKDNQEFPTDRTYFSDHNRTVTIENVVIEDDGIYICTMRNIVNASKSAFRVNVFKESQFLSNTLIFVLGVVSVSTTIFTIYGIIVIRRHRKAIRKTVHLDESQEHGVGIGMLMVDCRRSLNEQTENVDIAHENEKCEKRENLLLSESVRRSFADRESEQCVNRNAIRNPVDLDESQEHNVCIGTLVVDCRRSLNEQPENVDIAHENEKCEERENLLLSEPVRRSFAVRDSEQCKMSSCNPNYIIPPSMLTVDMQHQLGSGKFGQVYQGFLNADKQYPVAVKIIQSLCDDLHVLAQSEAKIMIHVGDHVNVLSLIGVVTRNLPTREFCIVTELCTGPLLDFLKTRYETFFPEKLETDDCQPSTSEAESGTQNSPYTVPEPSIFNRSKHHRFHINGDKGDFLKEKLCTTDLICFAYQIANGMDFLSSVPVIHRDLALRNILVTHFDLVRIADFGLSRQADVYYIQNMLPLPFAHMAPESLFKGEWSPKSDVYGVLLCELFSLGEKPDPNLVCDVKFHYDVINGLHPLLPENSFRRMNELISKCCQQQENERPTYDECHNIIGQILHEYCETCFTNLDTLLNDDANRLDLSKIREEVLRRKNENKSCNFNDLQTNNTRRIPSIDN